MPSDAVAMQSRAEAAYRAGDLATAEQVCRQILRTQPTDVSANVLLGTICARRRNVSAALSHLETALRQDPNCVEAHIVVSTILAGRQPEAAIRHAIRAVELNPDDPAVYTHLGLLFVSLRRFAEAVPAFERAVELTPNDVTANRNLASALRDAGREPESLQVWEHVCDLAPRMVGAWMAVAQLRLAHGNLKGALDAAEQAVRLEEANAPAQLLLALALSENGQGDQAEGHLKRSIELDPKEGLAHAALGFWMQEQGRFDEAADALRHSIDLRPTHGFAYYNLFRARKAGTEDGETIERMREMVNSPAVGPRDRTYFHYALGKVAEDGGDYETAMGHYDAANAEAYRIWLGHRPWDRETYRAEFTRTMDVFTAERMEGESVNSPLSELPVFIVGMIRSGTSLVEQILSSHPDIGGGGELPFWHEYESEVYDRRSGAFRPGALRAASVQYLDELAELAPTAKRITDKLPHNYALLGLIHTALPGARFIHVKRDPLDNALSVYTTAYQRPPVFAHDRSNIVFAYREYQRIVDHWRRTLPADRFLEIEYEEIVANREAATRRLIEFCRLEWNDACLRHDENRRAVRTPSLWQVRQPIYGTSIARGKRFEPWLGELRDLMA